MSMNDYENELDNDWLSDVLDELENTDTDLSLPPVGLRPDGLPLDLVGRAAAGLVTDDEVAVVRTSASAMDTLARHWATTPPDEQMVDRLREQQHHTMLQLIAELQAGHDIAAPGALRLVPTADPQRLAVHFPARAAAATSSGLRTGTPAQFTDVSVSRPDGRTATLRGKTGRSGSNVTIRLVGTRPPEGLWTYDNREVTATADVLLESADVPLETLLAEALRFGHDVNP